MCPSVWLTLDILAGRQKPNSGAAGITHYVDSWLDKLKASRDSDGRPNEREYDEFTANVQFGLEFNGSSAAAGSGTDKSVDEREIVIGHEVVGKPLKRKKRKKKKVDQPKTVVVVVKDAAGRKTEGKEKQLPENVEDMEDLKPIVDCSFDLPKSQVGCQRLMGTNVVRLTDKSFMQELRYRIKEDYNAILQKRIAAREAKEIERERTLAISSRTGCIPQTLAGKPVNLISKSPDKMSRSRAKLKTNREKNAERLIRQSIKWERERLISYELEKKKTLEAQKRREEELMVDRSDLSIYQYLHPNSARRAKGGGSAGQKTQIEDSPTTDHKLESLEVRDKKVKEEDQETDEGESDELVHDDDDDDDDDENDEGEGGKNASQVDNRKESQSGKPVSREDMESTQSKVIDTIATDSGTVIYSAPSATTGNGNSTGQAIPVSAIILTGDGIMDRLMAAETVEELYLIAEEIIGKTKVKRIKHLLSN